MSEFPACIFIRKLEVSSIFVGINTKHLSEATKTFLKIDSLNEEAWQLKYSQTGQAQKLAQEAFSLSEKNAYPKGIAYGRLNLSVCSFLLASGDDSLLLKLTESLHFFESSDDTLGQARALNYLGNVYDSYGEYEKGLNCCFRGLKTAEQIGYLEGVADLSSTSGNIYSRLGDYASALKYYQTSLNIRESANEMKAAASSMNLIARTYAATGDFENGLHYYQKSIRLREELNETGALPWNYLGLAVLYEKKSEPDMAFVYFSKSMALNLNSRDKRLDLHCLIGTGRYQLTLKNAQAGIEALLKALDIALELNAKPLLYEVHSLLSDLYELAGDTVSALNHFRQFHVLKEDVLNMESGNRLKNQQISFAVERSEQEAEIHRLRNVELKSAYENIEEKNADITASINYARLIQQAILPKKELLEHAFPQSFILFKPKDIVSGDFYWIHTLPANNGPAGLLVAAADCTGHGVPGALMSMLGIEKLNEASAQGSDVSEILCQLNRSLKKALGQSGREGETRDGMDIALIRIDPGTSAKVQYAGANRPLWLVRKDSGAILEIKATKTAIGGHTPDDQSFAKHELNLQTGDTLYLFSDGYADQFSDSGKKFMTRRFREMLVDIQAKSMSEQKLALNAFHEDWKNGMEQTDDVLVIGIRI
jgi:serine phosphatase RsbU (regulator of sigma subunit)